MVVIERPPLWSRTAAVSIGVLTVALRLLSLRNLPNDHYMHLVWANEVLAGQVPGRDFVDPGMPLMYLLSAAVQAVSQTPFADAVLWTVLLAVATACVCLVTARLTSSTLAGVLAGLIALAMEPRLYSAPKVLVPAVGLLLLHRYATSPGTRGLVGLAAWTTVAGLLRHDLGAYNALGVLVGLVVLHVRQPRVLARSTVTYVAVLLVCVLPYALFVQLSEGVAEHLRVGLEESKIEAHRLLARLPDFPFFAQSNATWSRVDSAAALFSAARLLPFVGLALLIWDRRRMPTPVSATAAAACATLAAYGAFVLRHPAEARAPDVAALVPIVTAWLCLQIGRHRPRALWSSFGLIVLVSTLGAAGHMSGSLDRLDDAQVWRGVEKMRLRAAAVHEEGSVWPWERFWSQGDFPPVIAYLNACTRPNDRVLVAWFEPEIYYFSKRLMAGGVTAFYPGRTFSADADQRRIIERMEAVRVPVVLTNDGRDPVRNMPLLDAHLQRHYTAAGRYTSYDGGVVTISTRRELIPTTTYGPDAWPCALDDPPAR